MAKTKKKGWINIYTEIDIDGCLHFVDGPWKTKEAALKYHRRYHPTGDSLKLEDTIQIEWEEEEI